MHPLIDSLKDSNVRTREAFLRKVFFETKTTFFISFQEIQYLPYLCFPRRTFLRKLFPPFAFLRIIFSFFLFSKKKSFLLLFFLVKTSFPIYFFSKNGFFFQVDLNDDGLAVHRLMYVLMCVSRYGSGKVRQKKKFFKNITKKGKRYFLVTKLCVFEEKKKVNKKKN